MPYGYDPFEGLVLPQAIGPRNNQPAQQYGAQRRQAQAPAYAPPKPQQPTTFRWDPMAQPQQQAKPPQPTTFRYDPNAQPQAAYARPMMKRSPGY